MADREHAKPGVDAVPGENGEESFLSRWSRLKGQQKVAAPEPSPAAAADDPAQASLAVAAPATEADAAPATETDAAPPGDEDMPPLESLTEDSDFSGFMSPRVSAGLRKQALRKLFRSDKFNVISELDDYIDDYRNFPPLGDTVTSDMKHAAARLLKKQLEAAEAAAADADAASSAAGSAAATAGADEVLEPADAEMPAESAQGETVAAAADRADSNDAEATTPGEAGEQGAAKPREPAATTDPDTDPDTDQEQPPRDA